MANEIAKFLESLVAAGERNDVYGMLLLSDLESDEIAEAISNGCPLTDPQRKQMKRAVRGMRRLEHYNSASVDASSLLDELYAAVNRLVEDAIEATAQSADGTEAITRSVYDAARRMNEEITGLAPLIEGLRYMSERRIGSKAQQVWMAHSIDNRVACVRSRIALFTTLLRLVLPDKHVAADRSAHREVERTTSTRS